MNDMRVLMLQAPTELLAERARKGLDRWDEMWDGVLHVVPAPHRRHQELVAWLSEVLRPLGRARGLQVTHEVNLHRPDRDDDYRIPDLAVYDETVAGDRGIEGGALTVFEVQSPDDESLDKVPWYLDVGVGEVVLIDRDTLHVRVLRGLDEDRHPIEAPDTTVESLGVVLERVAEDHLRVHLPHGEVRDIRP